MMDIENKGPKRAYCFTLTEKPCTILHIKSANAFIIGTYELVDLTSARKLLNNPDLDDDELEKKLKEVNNRLGSLYLYVNTYSALGYRLFSTHECTSGGVFDMVLSHQQCEIGHDKVFFVAHANGTIGQYRVRIDTILSTKQPIKVVEDSSVLLTCIDCTSYKCSPTPLIVVGDSKGHIIIPVLPEAPESNHELVKTQVCENPVWQVKIFPEEQGRYLEDDHLIVVGAEDSSWYIYKFYHKKRQIIQIYKNNDFQAGITSICFRTSPKLPHECQKSFRLFVGSYDETIREYYVLLGDNDERAHIDTLGSLKVPGAGIWRIDYVPNWDAPKVQTKAEMSSEEYHDTLNIATMYRDPCRVFIPISKRDGRYYINSLDKGRLEPIEYQYCDSARPAKEKPLYYGFVQSRESTNYCIIDFNNRLCMFLEDVALYSPREVDLAIHSNKKVSYSLKRWLSGEKMKDTIK